MVRKRLGQGVRRICPQGKPILRKSILTGKTRVIHHIAMFVEIPKLLPERNRCATPFGAGCPDREPEVSVLDMFREGSLLAYKCCVLLR